MWGTRGVCQRSIGIGLCGWSVCDKNNLQLVREAQAIKSKTSQSCSDIFLQGSPAIGGGRWVATVGGGGIYATPATVVGSAATYSSAGWTKSRQIVIVILNSVILENNVIVAFDVVDLLTLVKNKTSKGGSTLPIRYCCGKVFIQGLLDVGVDGFVLCRTVANSKLVVQEGDLYINIHVVV